MECGGGLIGCFGYVGQVIWFVSSCGEKSKGLDIVQKGSRGVDVVNGDEYDWSRLFKAEKSRFGWENKCEKIGMENKNNSQKSIKNSICLDSNVVSK
jgi:hypothetical protein